VNRRTAIKLGVATVAGFSAGYRFLPPSPSRDLEPVDTLAQRLYTSLDDEQRAEACVSYDHPLRQYHNRGVWGGGRSVVTGFNRQQRRILTDLMYSGLSPEGRQRIPYEDFTRWSGVNGMQAVLCGDPTTGPYQIILTGVHLNLRLGGKNREGVAFGGPQVYGDQRGNNTVGLPGNVYRDQFLLAQTLLHNLDDGRRKLALVEEAPVQTGVELQGRHGLFTGIPISELRPEDRSLAANLVDRILSTYAPADAAYARECLTANGGTDALFLSYYQHGEDGEIPEAQVFRLEGPAAVFYFRGHPHVHAFINVAMDGDTPLSVGEPLGTNPVWLDRAHVKALFEKALRMETRADAAYYSEGSVAGRLHPGTIRTGDIYSLESWQENAEVVEIRGSNLAAPMRAYLKEQNIELDPAKMYKIATSPYAASDLQDRLGRIESRSTGALIRDLTIAHLKSNGFS
jgi:hypothetical protein